MQIYWLNCYGYMKNILDFLRNNVESIKWMYIQIYMGEIFNKN